MTQDIESDSGNVLVGICTFNRNDGLSVLLDSLSKSRNIHAYRVVVVDNSPAGNARDMLATSYPWVEYIHEPEPGIAAARNRVLDAVAKEWALIFVDDDEYVTSDWFEKLIGYARTTSADVVFSPVLPDLPDSAPQALVRGQFFDRPRFATGTSMPFGPTNNTLVKTEALAKYAPARFDEQFSETGGSDVDLFSRLSDKGAELVWFDEAVVYEILPPERANLEWVKQRFRRMGTNQAVLLGRKRPAAIVFSSGVARVVVGALRLFARRILGRVPTRNDLGLMHTGVGIIGSTLGRDVREYKR